MKIRQIKEAVDWEKVMENNNNNIDRLARLRTQVNIDPVMEEVIDSTEKFDKNSKEVFTKLAKDAESTIPKDPDTGKKITRKPYTEKLTLDESLFDINETWYHFEYKSGANPYVAKTEKERDRLLRKYKGKVKKVDDTSFVIDDVEKSSLDLEEDYERPIATMGLTNTSGIGIYDLNDEEVTYAFIDGSDKEPVKETATIEYDCESDEDCRPYFSVGDTKYYIDEFMRSSFMESKNSKKKSKHLCNEECSDKKKQDFELEEARDEGNDLWKAYGEDEDEDEEDTVFDFVDARLFGTNKSGLKPNSQNYKKVYNFLSDVVIPIKGGRGRYNYTFFYPSNISHLSGTNELGRRSRRYPMSEDGIGVYLIDEDEAVLAKAVADELGFTCEVVPVSSNIGFDYVAKIHIPDSIMEMPIEDYLESIGKSLASYKTTNRKKGRQPKK